MLNHILLLLTHVFYTNVIQFYLLRFKLSDSTTMLFYRKTYIAVLLTFFVFVAARDYHSNVNWAFRNRHSIRDDGYPCHRDIGSSRSSDSIPIDTITHLNVSTTVYVSMEQIEVTWTPILNSCRDDFIGIYFAETPILTGMHAIYV